MLEALIVKQCKKCVVCLLKFLRKTKDSIGRLKGRLVAPKSDSLVTPTTPRRNCRDPFSLLSKEQPEQTCRLLQNKLVTNFHENTLRF